MPNIEWIRTTLSGAFPTLPSHNLENLSYGFAASNFQRTQPLLSQGQIWSKVYLVEIGLIRMHFLRRDGKEFNKNFYHEGSLLFPLTPAMQTKPSLFGISCIEDCKVWQCDINTFLDQLPNDTYQSLQHRLLTGLLDNKLQREHDLLALSAMQRYQKFIDTQGSLIGRIPLNHLATYLGMTDVSLSRLRRQLKKD